MSGISNKALNIIYSAFTDGKTYEEIESASTYYWNYQRYQMINDYVHRSPLAPPIIIVWHFYEAYKAIGNQCASLRNAETTKYNPFCKFNTYFLLFRNSFRHILIVYVFRFI
ncbi:unnamed protein product [Trichobilharzia regenti]|nr:unnamed protein product [Trichobilharzia regenti]